MTQSSNVPILSLKPFFKTIKARNASQQYQKSVVLDLHKLTVCLFVYIYGLLNSLGFHKTFGN